MRRPGRASTGRSETRFHGTYVSAAIPTVSSTCSTIITCTASTGIAGAGVTLSAAAIWGMPLMRPAGVVYRGDGIDAVEAFGPGAMLPGMVLFAVGCWWDG